MSLAAFAQGRGTQDALGSRRTIPFDYAFVFKIFDDQAPTRSFVDELLSRTITVSVEAAFVAVSIGYSLLPQMKTTPFGPSEVEDVESPPPGAVALLAASSSGTTTSVFNVLRPILAARRLVQPLFQGLNTAVDRRNFLNLLTPDERRDLRRDVPPRRVFFGELINSLGRTLGEGDFALRGEIGPQTARALLHGIRLNPTVAARFFLENGQASLTPEALARLFEVFVPPPDRIQFLYALYDRASGRAFQSEPLLNIAGLGTSDGDRPFRCFATPIVFPPRSNIQLDVIPKSEFKGELYVVLHGYKVLGGAGTPTGRKLRAGARPGRRR